MNSQLVTSDQTLELTQLPSTLGCDGIALGNLVASGHVTYDPGYANTAPVTSTITYIDGDAGILRHRGYPIEELARHATFLDVTWLLVHGELPTPEQATGLHSALLRHSTLHPAIGQLIATFPRSAHPMTILAAAVNALAAHHPDTLEIDNPDHVEQATHILLGQVPTIAAAIYRHTRGLDPVTADTNGTLVENHLKATFATEPTWTPDPAHAKALDMLLVLHADHEQNCSTSTVRMVQSAHANIYSSVAAGINALAGPLHGGANQAVLDMLDDIHQSGGNAQAFMERVKDRNDSTRLMGFGHRVYKNYDPRAALARTAAQDVLSQLNIDNPLLDIAQKLEATALNDEYFTSRKLYPNVDFYTGLIYQAIGYPQDMFTVMFALGRLPGWIAHWREGNQDPQGRIGRPRQIYTGTTLRHHPKADSSQ